MRLYILTILLVAAVAITECKHTFMGTNVLRPIVYHHRAQYSSVGNSVQSFNYSLPYRMGSIQGILAYDLTHSGATANVTQGGIGFNFVNLRMSSHGKGLDFDIYVYA